MGRGRVEAFSDGVFAVAITLLALNLAVAGPGHGPLLHQLADHWPAFAAYVVSFFMIGIVWVNHHSLLRQFSHVDRMLLFSNLLLLLFVVAIPFVTATLADYLLAGGQDARVAGALYAVVLEGMALSFSLMFVHAMRAGLLQVPLTPEGARTAVVGFGVGALVYVVAFALAVVWAPLVLILAAVTALYYVVERVPAEDEQSSREAGTPE
jgi:uncharacterized membrane protein